MNFEYDRIKPILNKHKHGISLEDAKELWAVPHAQLPGRVTNELRHVIIGRLHSKFYVCVFTLRGENGENVRLISARRSRVGEERIYHEQIKEERIDGQGV